MRMRFIGPAAGVAVGIAALMAGSALTPAAAAAGARGDGHGGKHGHIAHVLLISVDGLHQQDLAWYVRAHPGSALAELVRGGVEYSRALTPVPSDSFPGMAGQVTDGDPKVTGVYYDDTWNHGVFPAGTTNCLGPVPGGEASYTEAAATPGTDRTGLLRRPGPGPARLSVTR